MSISRSLSARSGPEAAGDEIRFGLLLSAQHPPGVPAAGAVREHLEQVEAARNLGFTSVWVPQQPTRHPTHRMSRKRGRCRDWSCHQTPASSRRSGLPTRRGSWISVVVRNSITAAATGSDRCSEIARAAGVVTTRSYSSGALTPAERARRQRRGRRRRARTPSPLRGCPQGRRDR